MTQVVATLIATALAGLCAWLWHHVRTSQRAQQWFSENVAYMRSGFRLQAALDGDHETQTARATIGKRVPEPPTGNQVSRMRLFESHPFQRRKSFAIDVYVAWVPFCSSHGWSELVISGWSPVTSRVATVAWPREWTLFFNEGNLVIAPGWTPLRPQEGIQRPPRQSPEAYEPRQLSLMGDEE